MANTVLIGLQWGDEGKGKIIDVLTEKADVVVRFQGGNNAGHTVEVGEDKFVLHLVPSGIIREEALCIIGNGVVVNPLALLEEIDGLRARGMDVDSRLRLGNRCHLVFDYHGELDGLSERRLGDRKIGTTKRGIGPAYADKVNRVGIRAGDLCHLDRLETRFRTRVAAVNETFAQADMEQVDVETAWATLEKAATRLAPLVGDTVLELNHAMDDGKEILFEGAQGTWLDVDYGTYPYVTSSNTVAGGACIGSGVAPLRIQHVLGVAKAYTTRVGCGPFPTELNDDIGAFLGKQGNEFGATTGRPRRCGWFDAVATRYAVMVNGADKLAVTKLDVLDQLETIRVCTAYELDGERITDMPADVADVERVKPVYEEFPGWQESTVNAQSWSDLPDQAKAYVKWLGELVGSSVEIISVGPRRTQTFDMES